MQCNPTTAAPKPRQLQPPVSPHLKVNMALAFFKTTNSAGLGIIVRDSHSSLIIVHTELIHLEEPCLKEISDVLEQIHAFVH